MAVHRARQTFAEPPRREVAASRSIARQHNALPHPSNSPLSCSPPFLSVALKRLSTHLERASSICCQKRTALPRRSPLARFSGLPVQLLEQGALGALPCFVLNDGLVPVGSFVVLCGPAPPVAAERFQDCPALRSAASSEARSMCSYSSLLPCTGVSITSLTGEAPRAPLSAAVAVPRLVLLFTHSVTSLGAKPQVISLYERPPGSP